jgi:hypothetical protein
MIAKKYCSVLNLFYSIDQFFQLEKVVERKYINSLIEFNIWGLDHSDRTIINH